MLLSIEFIKLKMQPSSELQGFFRESWFTFWKKIYQTFHLKQ